MKSKTEIAGKLLLSSPPGEIHQVFQALLSLAEEELDLSSYFEQYSKENLEVIKVDSSKVPHLLRLKIILSESAHVEGKRFLHAKSGQVIEVDFFKQIGQLVEGTEIVSEHENKSEIEALFENYLSEHYPDGLSAVHLNENKATVYIVATKYSPRNYWNGKWKSKIEIDLEGKTCTGNVSVIVHYYEEGNVQLNVNKPLNFSFSKIADIAKEIKSFEQEFQNGINQVYEDLSESTFKSLRRQLPITKSKMEWSKGLMKVAVIKSASKVEQVSTNDNTVINVEDFTVDLIKSFKILFFLLTESEIKVMSSILSNTPSSINDFKYFICKENIQKALINEFERLLASFGGFPASLEESVSFDSLIHPQFYFVGIPDFIIDQELQMNNIPKIMEFNAEEPEIVTSDSVNDFSFWSNCSSIFPSKVRSVKTLTASDSAKETILLDLDVAEMNWKYQPGDSFGLYPCNNDVGVEKLLQRLELDGALIIKNTFKEPFNTKAFLSLHEVFQYCLDFTSIPKKAFIRTLAEFCSDLSEKKKLFYLVSKQGAKYLERAMKCCFGFYDILCSFPSCKPPLSFILQALPLLSARYFSIANSPLKCCNSIQFVFNVVEYECDGLKREGLATSWLKRISSLPNIVVPIFVKSGNTFLLPEKLETPLILIGPGSGVAPFIGFIQHRENQKNSGFSIGDIWLYFGCRNREKDFLFREYLESARESGVLTELVVSFSRDDSSELKYVQHNMKLQGKEIKELIDNGACIYVCGDAKGMAKDVHQTLLEIFMEHAAMSQSEATQFLFSLMENKRYLRDIWG